MINSSDPFVLNKVVLFTTTLEKGGTERNLVVYAKELVRTGVEVEVWYLYSRANDYSKDLLDNGAKLKCFELNGRIGLISSLRKIASSLANSDTDLVHIFLPTVLYSYLFSRLLFGLRKPAVYSCGATKFIAPFEKPMTRRLAKSCYPFIGNSEAVSDALNQIGVPKRLLRVIPNGHDLAPYQRTFDRTRFRVDNNLPVDRKIIATVGRFIPGKRHVDLINAFAQLTKTHSDIDLLLVGDGDFRQELHSLVNSLGIESTVHFFGIRDDVPDCLRASDIFVFPTESEGLPNSLIEACLAKLPIVSTDIQPNLAVVRDEVSALLAPVRSSLQIEHQLTRLLDDPELCERLSSAAYENAIQAFSVDRAFGMLMEAYSDCLEHHKKNLS